MNLIGKILGVKNKNHFKEVSRMKKEVDIEKMHAETGILIPAIKRALDIPPSAVCHVSTLEKARTAYGRAPRGSEEEMAALLKWREFSAQEVEKASTLQEAETAYVRALRGSEEETAAFLKWREFSAQEVEKASTLQEAETAYVRAPEGSEEEIAAIRKIAAFFPK